VVTSDDWMNPHIRLWPTKRSVASQVGSITNLPTADYGLCLYPTPAALRPVRAPRRYASRPYSRAMAKGKGRLELVYFRFDVLEQYVNDPRFDFRFGDFGARLNLQDELYMSDAEPNADKIGIDHVGFAYDQAAFDGPVVVGPITRAVSVFYCDLGDLNADHQTRWSTYQLPNQSAFQPHPLWYGAQMGEWATELGPFNKFFGELAALNTLYQAAFGEGLFSTVDRPDGFGWILRPSKRSLDEFMQKLDKEGYSRA